MEPWKSWKSGLFAMRCYHWGRWAAKPDEVTKDEDMAGIRCVCAYPENVNWDSKQH